ncbi:hypothetical protein Scep_009736 [Stephania cephalantha]|uniref:Uncharacterized protein n=1 Tax=Stephania cephalantha TaxID=152367 RepID=A0AAP0JW05_9MAGN
MRRRRRRRAEAEPVRQRRRYRVAGWAGRRHKEGGGVARQRHKEMVLGWQWFRVQGRMREGRVWEGKEDQRSKERGTGNGLVVIMDKRAYDVAWFGGVPDDLAELDLP